MTSNLSIRPSPIAGTWYPGNPKSLSQAVDEYINLAELPELPGELVAVIAPHAGHSYSGPVAGYAFGAVREEMNRRAALGTSIDLVVIVSPMHQPFFNPLLTTGHDAYSTPLGNVMVDRNALQILDQKISSSIGINLTPITYDSEHSLEIELPFLQRVLPNGFKLLPVMVRAQSLKLSLALGEALGEVLQGKNNLLVGSTDLSHFYPQEQAREYDAVMLNAWEHFSPEDCFQVEQEGKGFACGLGALTTVLAASRQLGADTVKILHHATSGDVTGELSSVVGYGAAAIMKSPRK